MEKFIAPNTNRLCKRCSKKYIPTGKYQKLCDDCWSQARCGKGLKGDKRCGKNTVYGNQKVNTASGHYGLTGNARKLVKQRDAEIIRLNELVDLLSKENIRLKEEIIIQDGK